MQLSDIACVSQIAHWFATQRNYIQYTDVSDLNGALGHNSALLGYTRLGTTWANEMKFYMNHAPDAGLIAWPVDLQSSVLRLSPFTILRYYIPTVYPTKGITLINRVTKGSWPI